VDDGEDQQAHAEKGDEEADRGEEKPAAGPVGDAFVEDASGARQVEQQHHEGGGKDDEQQQNRGSGQVHRLPFLAQSQGPGADPIIRLGHFSLNPWDQAI